MSGLLCIVSERGMRPEFMVDMNGLEGEVQCIEEAALNEPSAIRGASVVVLDGASFGTRSASLAQRLRWLGFDGPILLASDTSLELDHVIARESGVTEILGRYPGSVARRLSLQTPKQVGVAAARLVRSPGGAGGAPVGEHRQLEA